jgi:predicted dehydrogenase
MHRLRVGLVGGGPWARTVHAPGLAAHPDTELAAVWTRRPEAAADLAVEYGARSYTDLEDLFDAVTRSPSPYRRRCRAGSRSSPRRRAST